MNKINFITKKIATLSRPVKLAVAVTGIILTESGCRDYVEVDTIKDKLYFEQVFDNDATANAATVGIYRQFRALINPITLNNSMVSDDIVPYTSAATNVFVTNMIDPTNTAIAWSPYYSAIYTANSAIEGLQGSKGLSPKAKDYYTAEAKFSRAFCYFNMVNLYGDVPLILTTDVRISSIMARSPADQVYSQIVADLKEAKTFLGTDYSYTGGDRSRANKWVAAALLSRTYLYQKDWINAEAQSTEVINSGLYSLLNGPTGISVKNNNEAIWQWANNTADANTIASNFIYTSSPSYVCTSFLLNAFETGDLRKSTWIKTQTYNNQSVSFPFKLTTSASGSNEWYTVMRLAEQYLIRAEARAMQNNLQGAIDDINLIRQKHGGLNTPLTLPANQTTALNIILKERQVELFTEGMHRWFDLKRTGRLNTVMLAEKPLTWNSWAAFYPIPQTDIQRNPNLVQNPGYQ